VPKQMVNVTIFELDDNGYKKITEFSFEEETRSACLGFNCDNSLTSKDYSRFLSRQAYNILRYNVPEAKYEICELDFTCGAPTTPVEYSFK
jgi:hypothetical protein